MFPNAHSFPMHTLLAEISATTSSVLKVDVPPLHFVRRQHHWASIQTHHLVHSIVVLPTATAGSEHTNALEDCFLSSPTECMAFS